MEGLRHRDPFLWDVKAVAEELCSLERPCTRDPLALTEKIRHEEMDGHALLTFDLVCSRPELFESLGVKLAGHRAALARAIVSLRSRSPAFRRWKLEFVKEQSEQSDDVAASSDVPMTDGAAVPQFVQGADQEICNNSTFQQTGSGEPETPKRKLDALQGPPHHGHGLECSTPTPNPEIPLPETSGDLARPGPGGDQPLKRKRVAPVQLTSMPINSAPLPLAAKADTIQQRPAAVEPKTNGLTFPWEQAGPHAYLGDHFMDLSAIKSSDRTLTTQMRESQGSFATLFPIRLPTGWRLIAGRDGKRQLIKNGHKEALLRQGLVPMRSPTPSEGHDEVLELSDLADSLDEETLREMEAEEAERANAGAPGSSGCVDQDRIHALLQEALDHFKARWEEEKLPKYRRKAHKLWTDVRRRGTRSNEILQARQRAKAFDFRIKKYWAEIMDQKWAKESDVCFQAGCLEQSVEDKLYNVWLADMLESRFEPAKPAHVPRPQRREAKRQQSPMGGEILTSSDEDDFVAPDDQDANLDGDGVLPDLDEAPMNPSQPATSPVKEDSPMYVDLTQVETPHKPPRQHRQSSVVDLTTPTHPRSSHNQSLNTPATTKATPTTEESFESVEQIGNQPVSHWVKAADRARLVICLLWKLRQARRTAVFDAARGNSARELFELSIGKQLSDPLVDEAQLETTGPETMAFDITRLYLSYAKVKNCKPKRILFLNGKDKNKLKAEGDGWAKFHDLLNRVAPEFPQDSQIYRTDAFDEELGDMNDDEDEAFPNSQDTPSKPRKNAPREIVQSKEAVDMRERERLRVEEQEARRLKLRAALKMSGSMSRDKSRLIINEAKQDDQAFIYVNEETGKRIKDHQIGGVRFMWNQILMPESQGCLLAHSMGLGKTMQVITLLVAMQESAQSPDPAVRLQIPEDLRKSKSLVLCPAGLVNNWMDELLIWAPDGLLGPIRSIEAVQQPEERRMIVEAWAKEGGILVAGYPMLKRVIAEAKEMEEKLVDGPNIVVADEAHVLKNQEAKVHKVCSRFTTRRRIALTGSPLANNVEEYYCMVDWVAPNYLGSLREFRQMYSKPIQQGLWLDSTGFEKRKALKMLQVLKETVAPKVNRKSVKSCMKDDLPPKHEFVLCIPATALQKKLYDMYVTGVYQDCGDEKITQSKVFAIVSDLGLLCNHPRCFRQRAQEARQSREGEMTTSFPDRITSTVLKETNLADIDDPVLSVKTELLLVILDEARRVRDKVLVFSHSLITLNYLEQLLRMKKRRVCRLDGNTAIAKRQDMIKKFNTGDHEVYVISTRAGNVGLNIQGANRVVIFDFKYNPVNEQQAVGRAYRIGQQKAVYVYHFVMAGTFEEVLHNKAVFKTQLASRVVDKKNPVSWSKRDLGKYLRPIKHVPARALDEFAGKDQILDKLISFKSDGQAIRFIVSTDTFEEEDPDDALTAEERREAANLAKMNILRVTDPEEYDRKWGEEQRRLLQQMQTQQAPAAAGVASGQEAAGAPASQTAPGTPVAAAAAAPGSSAMAHRPQRNSFQPQSPGAAAAAAPAAAAAGPVAPAASSHGGVQGSLPHTPSAAPLIPWTAPPMPSTAPLMPSTAPPMPVAGATTYFGSMPSSQPLRVPPARVVPSQAPPPASQARPPTPPPSSAASLFSPPRRSRAKDDFEKTLMHGLEYLQAHNLPRIAGDRQTIARNITAAIDRVRKDRAFGFLPDDQQWNLLKENMRRSPRLASATVVGHITAKFLALAKRSELEGRVKVLESLSEEELSTELSSGMRTPDPENLENLRRAGGPSEMEAQSSQAKEDMMVMREAADNRRQRSNRPSVWAGRVDSGRRD